MKYYSGEAKDPSVWACQLVEIASEFDPLLAADSEGIPKGSKHLILTCLPPTCTINTITPKPKDLILGHLEPEPSTLYKVYKGLRFYTPIYPYISRLKVT